MKKTRPHKILVVEDSEALLTYLSEILQLHKYEVALARTFAEAEGYVRSVFFFGMEERRGSHTKKRRFYVIFTRRQESRQERKSCF